MSSITIPLHLLIPTLLSLIAFIFLLVKRKSFKKKNKILFKSGLIFFFSYALLVGNALGHDLYYQWNLNQYDLDQDGFFTSPAETTPQQRLAMQRLINDVGRNSSFISGFIVSAILSLSTFILLKINHALFEEDESQTNNLTV